MTPTRRSTRIAEKARLTAEAAASKTEELEVTKLTTPAKKQSKKRGNGKASATPESKRRKTGLKSSGPDSPVVGVVDPESKIEGTIEILDNSPCDVMLVQVDPQKNMDKFYILQLIQCNTGGYAIYSRWGRTGKTGQGLDKRFDNYNDAMKCFKARFKDKSGLIWEDRINPTVDGKYRFIQQNFVEKQHGYTTAKWQYWVDDGVDGKATGWYDYVPSGSIMVEQLFHENSINPSLKNRLVESGTYTYDVDLSNMTQTNITHSNRTSRKIRRYLGEEEKDEDSLMTTSAVIKASTASLITPNNTPNAKKASSSSKQSPPVDPDIDRHHRATNPSSSFTVVWDEENEEWCDVVLNQCNITEGNNNNKYYRLQLLQNENTEQFYVWFKWGRVGEVNRQSQNHFKGPFKTFEAGLKVFAKKYLDKTMNEWGDKEFVQAKNKYTRIQIDTEASSRQKVMKVSSPSGDVEYLPSKLDNKTKELMEVLFSKDMRNEVLATFDLDLKRLPLGVPSEQQIQIGISILNEIEDKLGGGDISESYHEISSRFYTAIPHSFGRRVPPVIDSQTSLQQRYDMCNILLDMFSQNEAIRKIEENQTTQKVPYPADSHYDSLNADMEHIDKNSDEWKTILKYFNETKNSGTLLDAWKVDRKGEQDRFCKFDKLDNCRLLWHGTNIGVVAPIITSGLRIMPHSGGRVGSGIYLASMQQKSAQYTSGYGSKFACMFLCEGALGKPHVIYQDDWTIKHPPTGFDSVLASGQVAPKVWKDLDVGRKQVSVPQSKGEPQSLHSAFYHDEFLVYNESQVRLRYVLTVQM